MVRLHFNTAEEFEGLFKRKTLSVTRSIVNGIDTAVKNKNRTALLFEITFDDVETMYEISLPKSQWNQALNTCLEHLHSVGTPDEQIDCWQLLEKIKNE